MSTKLQELTRATTVLCLALAGAATALFGQTASPAVLRINADAVAANVSPMLYGLMTEEINFSYDGGLYGELVRNRIFKESATEPVHWQLVQAGGGIGSMALDPSQPFNERIATSLKLTVTDAAGPKSVGIANEGFWGIPVKPDMRYRASFYARAAPGFTGPLTVSITSNDGATVHATGTVPRISGTWRKYEVALTTGKVVPSATNRFVISASGAGTVWFSMVSLFPPTWDNRPNGNRQDIMQMLADMKPGFLRFPGGNYLEGNTIATRFQWKNTIGDISQRPGHMNDAWRYWSSDGMGLLEFMQWCEDLNMEPVLGVYAGYSLRQSRVAPGVELQPFVQEAMDEIEYVTGDASTTWGARRAKDGHPAPFKLRYVEVGNEDYLDRQAGSFESRFGQFYDAIKAKYPRIKVITSTTTDVQVVPVDAASRDKSGVPNSRTPDILDEHYYRRSEDEMASHEREYDARPRPAATNVFVGEFATMTGSPTGNMSAALGDAAWMAGMERNSDIVVMSSYAPLFVNVNKGAMQWRTNLIGYDALTSYGSPTYYALKMFSLNHGDVVVPVVAQDVPTREWQPPAGRSAFGAPTAAELQAPPPARQVPTLHYSVTRDSKAGTIYVKVVNRAGTQQPVRLALSGVISVEANGRLVTMSAGSPTDTNSITEPTGIVPVTTNVNGLSKDFTRNFPPYSVSVLVINAR